MSNRLRLLLILLPCLFMAVMLLPGARRAEEAERAASPKASPVPTKALAGNAEPALDDWEEPAVLLCFTGRQHGYIEPCGCTGLENQKGGLNRRYSFLEEMRERGWNVVPLDIGNQVRRFGRQPELKFQGTIHALREMQYDAIGLGPDDLGLTSDEVFASIIDPGLEETEFVCANVSLLDLTPKKMQIIESGGLKIGVTSIVGDEYLLGINGDSISKLPAAEALPAVLEELEAADCDLLVLLSHATIAESTALAQQFPEFDLVATAGGAGEPAYQPEEVAGTGTQLIQVGVKGMYISALGIYPDAAEEYRFEVVPLDARFPDARPMLDIMAEYQKQLEDLGLEGLHLDPQPHPTGRQFVGSDACADCHFSATEVFEGTPHAHAMDSIAHPTERSEIPRHYDPECLSCHVTGWDPQGYYPYTSGYLSLEETPHLQHNGCENCHGPGSAHVAAENYEIDVTDEQRRAYREGMRLTLEDARENCLRCHDIDNSPAFHEEGAFEEYWEEVEHHGKY